MPEGVVSEAGFACICGVAMVDVAQLRALRAVAEAGSITAAAGVLGMSQPGLSRLIERVEDELQTTLLVRGRRGAELTEDGHKFLEFARSTLGAYDTLRASIGRNRSHSGGGELLKVVASTTPGEFLLPRIASDFAAQFPGVAIDTLIADSATVAGLLLSQEYDVGFSGNQASYDTLRYVAVASDEIVLAVPASHRFASVGFVELSQLAGERILRRENGSGTYEAVSRVLEASGEELPNGAPELTLGSTQSVMSAVDAGLGVGFVTLRAIEHYAPSRVVGLRFRDTPVKRELYLVYEPERDISESATEFIRFVEDEARAGRLTG